MWFSTFILANLVGRPIRSALTIVGVSVAVCAVVALLGIVRGFERSLLELYEQRDIDLLVYQSGRVQLMSSVLPESLGKKIATLEHVSEVSPVLTEVLSLTEGDLVGVTVQGWQAGSTMMQSLDIVEGRLLQADDRRGVLLGASLASVSKKKVGDELELLEGEPFKVIGIYRSFNVFDNGAAVTNLTDLQEIMLRQHEVTLFAVIMDQHDETAIESLQREIRALGPSIEVNAARELAEQSAEIRMARAFAWITSAIALMIGSIGMLNTMMMSVFERTREIAMLRALGWRRKRIITLIVGESMILSLAGACLGSLFALVIVKLLSMVPDAGRVISAHVSWQIVLQGFLIAWLLGLFGGLFPAWKASRLLPVEGLRHD